MAQEQHESQYPDTVWDEYVGQYVSVQLIDHYIGITQPGQPARVQTDQGLQLLTLPLVVGIFGVKKDARGGVRVTILTKDPDESKAANGAQVRVDLPTDMIGPISITSPPDTAPESKIIVE